MADTPSVEEVFPPRDALDGAWRIDSTLVDARRVLVRIVHDEASERVEFALWSATEPSPPGPFDAGTQRISYKVSEVPFERFRAAGSALGERLRRAAGGVDPSSLVQRWIAEGAREPRRLPVLREGDGGSDASTNARPETLLPQATTRPVVAQQARDGVLAVLTSPAATAAVVIASVESALRSGARDVVLRGDASMCAEVLAQVGSGAVRVEVTARSRSDLTALPAGSVLAVRLPATREAMRDLRGWVEATRRDAPGAALVVVMPTFEGRVSEWLATTASLSEMRDALSGALPRAKELGVELAVDATCGIPRCAAPANAAWRATSWGTEVARSHAEACDRCSRRDTCGGLLRDYEYLRGVAELVPDGAGAKLPGAAIGVVEKRAPARTERPWADRLRERLVDRRDAIVQLSDVLSHDEMPPWLCSLPWTRLEVNGLTIGPCCSDFQTLPAPYRQGSSLATYWNGPAMRAFRRALVQGPPIAPCRSSCPYLRGGTEAPSTVPLFGGPAAFVEREVELVEDMLRGVDVVRGGPLKVSFTTTTYCNYDCLMCSYGEFGTLDDELPQKFYDDLMTFAPGLRLVEALGGEPLASPVFREFLAGFDFERHPAMRVALITNGSYLSPKEQARYRRVPFDNLTISLNAATPETYLEVNRGLAWERVRENLDELLRRRREGELRCSISYSMVILKRNLAEVRAFAELARRDGVNYRYLLPNHDRNGQSILTSRETMSEALEALEDVLAEEWARGNNAAIKALLGEVRVLEYRLANNIVRPIPDGVAHDDARARHGDERPRPAH